MTDITVREGLAAALCNVTERARRLGDYPRARPLAVANPR